MDRPEIQRLDLGVPQLPIELWHSRERAMLELSKSAVCRLLQYMGLSRQRPIYRSYKQDPQELERYLNKTFPELRALAQRTGAEIYFVDESAVRSDHHRGSTWAPIGKTPVVEDSGDRFTLKLIFRSESPWRHAL